MPRDFIPPDSLRRILVVKLRHHGDVLLTSPVFSALKKLAPMAEIDALVYADTHDMLSGHPAIAQLHTIDRNWKRLGAMGQFRAEAQLLATLRNRGYDLVVNLTEHTRGAWLTRLLRPRWSVAPDWPGKPVLWKKSFSHHYPIPAGNTRHTVQIHLDALRALGLRPAEEPLTLVPGVEAEHWADALLRDKGLESGKFIHAHPASRWLFKCWPADRFASMLGQLQAEGWPVVLTSAPDEKEERMLADIIGALPRPAIDLSGQLSLKQLAALSARARLFIGVDSAPMHIAAAMQTPTVAIFGPSGDIEWAPWQTPHRVVASLNHPCRPCGQDGCEGSKISECLTTLPVEQVLTAVHALLESQ